MISANKLFENFFDDNVIIPARLGNFAGDALNNLTVNNTAGDNTVLISLLTPAVNNFKTEIGEVDSSFNVQKGTTLTVDDVLTPFKETMSSEEPFIARAVGGRGTPAYLEFYPKGISEYSGATKTNMPMLTARASTAAKAHDAELGVPLTAVLKGFEGMWGDARDKQQKQMGAVGANRSERSANRVALELALLTAVHTIPARYPGNVQQCLVYFQFNLLFAQTKHKHKLFSGSIAAGSKLEVLNRLFTDTATITIRNTDDNAILFAWLAATPGDAMPADALEVLPGQAREIKPSKLGPLANPFLLLYNGSTVNEGAWEVEVVG